MGQTGVESHISIIILSVSYSERPSELTSLFVWACDPFSSSLACILLLQLNRLSRDPISLSVLRSVTFHHCHLIRHPIDMCTRHLTPMQGSSFASLLLAATSVSLTPHTHFHTNIVVLYSPTTSSDQSRQPLQCVQLCLFLLQFFLLFFLSATTYWPETQPSCPIDPEIFCVHFTECLLSFHPINSVLQLLI